MEQEKVKRFVAFYSRVSTAEQHNENQILVLEDFRKKQSISWDDIRTFADVGSGKTASRPGFRQLVSDIQKGLIEKIIVRDLSRLYRNMEEFLGFIRLLEKYNVELISIREKVDLSSAMGRAMFQIALVFAELERNVLRERTIDGLLQAKKDGKQIGRPKGVKDSRKRKKAGYYLRWQNKKQSSFDHVPASV